MLPVEEALHEVRQERRITSARAAKLFQLDSAQAGRLLRRMRDKGALVQEGDRRSARYICAD